MIIYGCVKVKAITYSTVLITWCTIILCYILAVSLGHVPAWLPMISDCAVEAPEKYPFRLGLIAGATALFANVIMVYYAFPNFSFRKLQLALGLVASVGLATVGAVNEKENNTVHTAAAIVFFLGYDIYMTIIAYNAPTDDKISSASVINKRIFAVLGIILLVGAGLFSLGGRQYKVYVALCEWLGTLGIEIFNLTFIQDFTDLALLEVKLDKSYSSPTGDWMGNCDGTKLVAVEKKVPL